MMRRLAKWILTCAAVLSAASAWAQDAAPSTSVMSGIDWKQLVALLINGVLVTAAVQALKIGLPGLSAPAKQIAALLAGPVTTWAAAALAGVLGYPIDLSPIAGVLTGATAGLLGMSIFDLGKRASAPS